jgi:hypothetical protein
MLPSDLQYTSQDEDVSSKVTDNQVMKIAFWYYISQADNKDRGLGQSNRVQGIQELIVVNLVVKGKEN